MASRGRFYLQTTGNEALGGIDRSATSSPSASRDVSPISDTPRPVSPLLDTVDTDQSSSTAHPPYGGTPIASLNSNDSATPGKSQKKQKDFYSVINGWWWEISAALLSIVAMVLLLILLLKSNNRSLESWKLPIQPNSLISVFTTAAKTSMMVPVASCISQLKWRHFMCRSDNLNALQVFDDASRGPWGSAMLLLSIRKRAVLAWALGFVTIVSLGIDPSAQQIIDFPTRVSPLKNVTATLGRADNYISKGYLEGDLTNSQVPNPNLLKLQVAILNGASGSVRQPAFRCPSPASRCEWDHITSLGICSEFKNLTHVATKNCTGNIAFQMNCTYDFPGRRNDPIEMSYNTMGTSNAAPSDLFQSVSNRDNDFVMGSFLNFEAVKVVGDRDGSHGKPPSTEVYQAKWFWCARDFMNVTAVAGALTSGKGNHETLSFVEVISSLNGDLDKDLDDDFRYENYKANSTGKKYNITTNTALSLWNYLAEFLSHKIFFQALSTPEEGMLDIGSFLYTSDISSFTENLATTLTNQIRTNSSGDNSAAVTANGTALFKEVYIRVRWGWFILPMTETFLVAALLIAVILVTHRQPLLKESVMPYVIYGGDHEIRDALSVSSPVTGEEMSEAGKKVTARLTKLNDEPLRFVLDGTQK